MIKVKGSDNAMHSMSDVAVKLGGTLYHGVKMVTKKNGVLYTIWEKVKEFIESTFLDKHGRPFYDKHGVPFQGRQ